MSNFLFCFECRSHACIKSSYAENSNHINIIDQYICYLKLLCLGYTVEPVIMFCISLLYYILLFQYGELLKLQLKRNKGMVLSDFPLSNR